MAANDGAGYGEPMGERTRRDTLGTRSTRLQEVQPEAEWDPPYSGTNVLWGRVAVLAIVLVLAFLIGRISAPNGIPLATVDRLQSQLDQAQNEMDSLRSQLDDAQATIAAQASPSPSGSEDTATGGKATTYVVKPGDSLSSIAAKFYGDASLGHYIAESNDLTDPGQLKVDQTLKIPPKP